MESKHVQIKSKGSIVPRICTVCVHPNRTAIDGALVDGEAYRFVAKRFGVSESAVYRHQQSHLPESLVKAREAAQQSDARTLYERLMSLNQETQTILREARANGNNAVALQAIGRVERQLELEARLLGQLDERVKIAVGVNLEASEREDDAALFAETFSPEELAEMRNRLEAVQAKKRTSAVVVV